MKRTVGDSILENLSTETPAVQFNLIVDMKLNPKSSRRTIQALEHNNYISRQKYGQTYLILLTEKGKHHVEYLYSNTKSKRKTIKLEPVRMLNPSLIHEKAVTKLCPGCNKKIPISPSVTYTVCPRCLTRIKVIKAISDQTHRHGIILRAAA
jgi:predicted transcriptional regulator